MLDDVINDVTRPGSTIREEELFPLNLLLTYLLTLPLIVWVFLHSNFCGGLQNAFILKQSA